jgi:hypothetical protein
MATSRREIPAFAWKRALSPVIRLSVIDADHQGGATGDQDAELTTLAWGVKDEHPLSPGVLAFPTMLKDAVLYSFSSESLNDQQVDLRDNLTGAHMMLQLPAQRGAAMLLRRSDGHVLAS